MDIVERFLQYVSFETTSDETSETCPSSSKELELGRFLAEEMKTIGLENVRIDADGYVYGELPAVVLYLAFVAASRLGECLAFQFLHSHAGPFYEGTLLGDARNRLVLDGDNFFGDDFLVLDRTAGYTAGTVVVSTRCKNAGCRNGCF